MKEGDRELCGSQSLSPEAKVLQDGNQERSGCDSVVHQHAEGAGLAPITAKHIHTHI